jgi:glycosyltransferase involved in cell wall biosynthesis
LPRQRQPIVESTRFRVRHGSVDLFPSPMSGHTPLRIGLMLRSLDEQGGIGVYTRYLTEALLRLGGPHHFVLFYRTRGNIGRLAGHPHVTERVVRGWGKVGWDQVGVPLACRRERIDVLFHPKFTVPFAAPCPVVMTVHGADWFFPEHAKFYGRLDVAYIRTVMPWYFRRAASVLSVSQITTDDFNQILSLPAGKVVTTYLAPGPHFRRVEDVRMLGEVRRRYRLPERFILTLSKVGGGERKNIAGILKAYRELHGSIPQRLVIGGKDCDRFRGTFNIPDSGWGAAIDFPGWIKQEDLPAVYSLADLFLYPSNLEAFPIPVTEAMACGVPVVTSRTNGLREIAGDAAVLVNPDDSGDIVRGVDEVLSNPGRHAQLAAAGLERAKRYSWELCARETLAVLEGVARTHDANPVTLPGNR